ncbi:MAG TPA: hypothetical protein V6C88_17680 [Chroococcidiopsis sp.]
MIMKTMITPRITPRITQRVFLTLLTAIALLSIGSCKTTSPSNDGGASSSASPAASPSSPSPLASGQSPAGTASSPAGTVAMTTVKIYQADSECVNYVAKEIQVPRDRAIEAAVGKVLEVYNSPDFNLSGYRVSVDAEGVATVDLRIPPDAPRQITSLSACEQFALFGSLRETLVNNPDWKVKTVHFTERGKDISL